MSGWQPQYAIGSTLRKRDGGTRVKVHDVGTKLYVLHNVDAAGRFGGEFLRSIDYVNTEYELVPDPIEVLRDPDSLNGKWAMLRVPADRADEAVARIRGGEG